MEYRFVLTAFVLGVVTIVSAGTSVSTAKSHPAVASSKSVTAESERGGWGWDYPTGWSGWSSGLASVGLPLILIPLIYFGFLWCVLLFGVAAFHHVPHHGHGGGHHHGGGGWGWGWGGHGHRHRRSAEDADFTWQDRVLSSL